ncbi:hypothetical protein [Thermofilum sp.]|uniref:hypothetical protein n=1 Tax=Thermofilum sp. TaxID=1961369 RepID=UPI00316FCCA4
MASIGLRSATMLGFLIEEYIEDARTIWWYWQIATKQVTTKRAAPPKFLRFFEYVDIDYNENGWVLRFTAQAKDKGEIANEMSTILGNIYIPFVGNVNAASAMYKNCDIIIQATNIGNVELGRLKPNETSTLTLNVNKIYPLINVKVTVNYTVSIPIIGIDYTATDSVTFDIGIDTGDYAGVEKKWKAGALKTYVDNAEEIRKQLDRLSKQIDSLLDDWLDDKKPDKEILMQLEPALNNYKELYENFTEAHQKVILMSKQMGLIPPNLGQVSVYKLVKGINDLPPRDKLNSRLQQISADITKYAAILINDVYQVNQEVVIMQSELEQLRNAAVQKLSQLGTSYAKATTQADRQNILNQKDAVINDYLSKKNEITAKHRQRIAELLNKCHSDKAVLDKYVAAYNYLTGNSLIGGGVIE